jgi:signal peptidase
MAVTHRIVAFTEEGIVTRGDANNVDDRPIAPEQIKGEVVCAIPLVGYAVNGVKSPLGTLCVLGLAIFLLERSFRAERQKDAEEMETIRAEIERLKQKNDP